MNRQWIGIDITIHAINRVTRARLEARLGLTEGKDFVVDGVPNSVDGARARCGKAIRTVFKLGQWNSLTALLWQNVEETAALMVGSTLRKRSVKGIST